MSLCQIATFSTNDVDQQYNVNMLYFYVYSDGHVHSADRCNVTRTLNVVGVDRVLSRSSQGPYPATASHRYKIIEKLWQNMSEKGVRGN